MGKSGIAVTVAACLFAGVASAQPSLAEAARKERERRAQVRKLGVEIAVISDKDLEEARSGSFSVSGAASAPPKPSGSADEREAGPSSGARSLSAKEINDLRVQWARIWRGQLDQAEQEVEQARNDVYQCRSASHYFFVPLAVDCDGVALRLARAEALLKKVKSNRYNWELLLPQNPQP